MSTSPSSTSPSTATGGTSAPHPPASPDPLVDSPALSDHHPTPPPPPPQRIDSATSVSSDKGKRKASITQRDPSADAPTNPGQLDAREMGEPRQKKKVKVGARASIACKTCRKRKVRCSGEWPVCRFCTGRKLPCVYEGHPAENGGPTCPGPGGWTTTEAVQSPAEPILPDSQLTVSAFETFLTHYHDTFPFLHRQSLTESILNGSASRELVCCILALAARFCQPLRDLHPSSPSAASEYYAVLASQLLALPDSKPLFPPHTPSTPQLPDSEVSLTRCQCYLLLSLYELTAGRDHSGWLKLGQAIRMAQILRLGFEDEVDYPSAALGDDPRGRGRSASSSGGSRDSSSTREKVAERGEASATTRRLPRLSSADFIKAEARRRTFWSCFLLDRTISDGNERPCGLKVPKISSLRMPGSDADFAAGRKGLGAKFDPDPPAWSVSIRMIQKREEEEQLAKEEEEERRRSGLKNASAATAQNGKRSRTTTAFGTFVEPEADLYGFTLRIADIWRSVASYIGAGGRNVDRRPPWQQDSTFSQLAGQLNEFGDRLPKELRYTDQTLIAHCMTSSIEARLFGMLHLLFATASHVLHRDYLPFLPPADFKASNGPVDGEPLYGEPTSPPDWWQKSFDVAAHSGNIISDVCSHLASHGIVLAHPFAGFAALAAGTVHCHLKYWPQDTHASERATHYFNQDAAILNSLRNVYPIAARWCESLAGLQLLYFNLSRGVLDADPLKVRAGVIQLLRSAKDDQESAGSPSRDTVSVDSTSNGNANANPNGGGQTNGKVTMPQPPTIPPLSSTTAMSSSASHQRDPSNPLDHHLVSSSSMPSPASFAPSSSLSLTPSLLPVPGSDLPTDFSFDLNAMASVPGFGFGFDDLGYWGSGTAGSGWLSGGFGGLGGPMGAGFGSAAAGGGSAFGLGGSGALFGNGPNDLTWGL
ncbi:hypothetical protein JCM10212_006897 [Sporobolomyces blumeae]